MAQKITVAELLVDLGVGKNDAAKAAGKLDDKLGKAKASAKLLGGGLKQLAKGFAVFAAAASAAAIGVFKFVKSVALSGDEIIKTAKKIGAGVEELQRLRFAADRSGADVKRMDLAIKNVAKNMEDARNNGALPFRQALEELGLSLSDIEGLPIEQKIGIIADEMKTVEDAGQRTALAMNLFGARAGPELVPLLLEGSKGIKALGDEAERLGLVMSEDSAKRAEVFVDSITDLKAVLTGLKNEIGIELIPIVQSLVKRFTEWVIANKGLLRQRVSEFFTRIIEVAKKLLPVFETLGKAFVFVVENLDIMIAIFAGAKLAGAFSAAATGFTALGLSAAAALGPIGLILGALVALTPAAIAAGNALGDFLAGEDLTKRTKKRGAPATSGKASKTGREVAFASRTATTADNEIRRLQKLGLRGNSPAIQRQIAVRDSALKRKARGEKKLAAERAEEQATEERFAADRPALGPELPPGFGEEPKRKGGRGKRTSQSDAEKTKSDKTFLDLLTAARGGDLSGFAAGTPSTEGIEPTVAVSIVNNNYKFDITQTIDGSGAPVEVANLSAKKVREFFEGKLAQAGQALQTNVVI